MTRLTYGPRDFPEDAERDPDNGAYSNICPICREQFIGNKRRSCCKVCLDEWSEEEIQQRADD